MALVAQAFSKPSAAPWWNTAGPMAKRYDGSRPRCPLLVFAFRCSPSGDCALIMLDPLRPAEPGSVHPWPRLEEQRWASAVVSREGTCALGGGDRRLEHTGKRVLLLDQPVLKPCATRGNIHWSARRENRKGGSGGRKDKSMTSTNNFRENAAARGLGCWVSRSDRTCCSFPTIA